ncbi:pyrroline-5-carboxylate reductase [Paraburkholderia rhynchosiae]|uniref:Pyrroline-5-carboxylate reductase n=1 Tax=Paraburkholderia rhynchosiae TaxID=487049 RepID=A0A2N7WEY2_9BURK|nr:pyrroline-5-carboxylate reductase [Paraburkholderia rhynchosiae]PMS28006.1 pyrroline-5-carboxylate reductase [Paraburkholderia rhynchosiae]CAB3722997.1 Pyrroline-5-carboxylate reductase [Paraburkholderia rhynchosiae]
MRLGFIGTGIITQAVVTGLLRSGVSIDPISLSPRNGEIAARLAALDGRVQVCASNQEVLETSDVVCLAVIPQIATGVLSELRFDARHHVISFIAGIPLDEVRRLVGSAGSKVVRAIPLPAVAEGKGSTAICPPDAIAKSLFSALGEAVEVDDEHKFDALSAVTATMASFFAVLEAQASWLVGQGLDYDAARSFLSGYCVGLAHDTTRGGEPFTALIEHCMTPGGINEQVHTELLKRGTYSHFGDALDRVLTRLEVRV